MGIESLEPCLVELLQGPQLPVALRTGLDRDRDGGDTLLLSEKCQSRCGWRNAFSVWGEGVARRTVAEPECSSEHESWNRAIRSPEC